MSSPPTPAPKESRLSIRASEADKRLLAQAARARRQNTSQFVLQASLDAARTVVADQTECPLPPDRTHVGNEGEGFPIQVEADFPRPRMIQGMAHQHRQFLAALNEQFYEVELIDDPA